MNILIFTAAICIMAAVMTLLLANVIDTVSTEYAEQYARSSAEALSVHINKEIDLVSKMAHSPRVIEWLKDESNEEKMNTAVREMRGVISDLYSYNMYIGLESSLNQYRIGANYMEDDILHINKLDESNPRDEWYFTSIRSGREYILDIGIDWEMQRKRVWIDYNIIFEGECLGVISTGLEFSHMVSEIFSHYEKGGIRGLIIDDKGYILMDSARMDDSEFLFSEFEERIDEELTDAKFLKAVETYLAGVEGYFEDTAAPLVTGISYGPFRTATITPIRVTNWSVIILSGGVSLFDITYFIPILVTVLASLIVVALVTSAANDRLIFMPLGKLDHNLIALRESAEGRIYGADRDDELGDLSKTIQDLFAKANVDALTGIYNRRFMENNLERVMEMLSRANAMLSVLMVDIDFFKKYNDTYGHEQGDVCLQAVSRAMTSGIMRVNDFAARYGGEEFVAVLPNTDENGAKIVAEKLLDKICGLNIPHEASTVAPFVTVSVGVTSGRVEYGQSWKDYIKRADEALYQSKNSGRNRFTFLGMGS